MACNSNWKRNEKIEALSQPVNWVDDWASIWTGKKMTNAKVIFTDKELV